MAKQPLHRWPRGVYADSGPGRHRRCPRRAPRIHCSRRRLVIPDPPDDETFDSAFLSELEGLVADSGMAVSSAAQGAAGARGYRETLAALPRSRLAGRAAARRRRPSSTCPRPPSPSAATGSSSPAARSPRRDAAQAVESFIVFFQALVPTLAAESSREVKATFFRLVPTARADGVGGPRRRGRPAPREPRRRSGCSRRSSSRSRASGSRPWRAGCSSRASTSSPR